MRICSPELGLSPTSNSGGEVHDREVLAALARVGVEIEIFLPRGKPYTPTPGCSVQRVFAKHIWPSYLFNLILPPYLFRIYRKRPFDLLRVHSPYFVGPAAVLFRRLFPRVPLVVTYHHVEPGNSVYDAIDRWLILEWDRIITVSEFTRQELLRRYHARPEKVIAIHNGVSAVLRPLPKDESLARRLGVKGKRVLLFLGGLKARKNLQFLLEAFAQLEAPNTVLLIAGSGRERASLKRRVRELGISDRVVFSGYVPEEEKVAFYNLADIFLLPSEREGFGMVATEAMACGVPVLVPRSLAFQEFVTDGVGGFLLPANDHAAWRDAMTKLLASESLRREIGERGRERVTQEFTWERAARKHLAVYEEVVRETREKHPL